MNERIKELAIESGLVSESWNNRLVSSFVEDSDVSEEVKDFVELIVKECIEEFAFSETDNVEIIQDRFTQCRKVAKHFGVEE